MHKERQNNHKSFQKDMQNDNYETHNEHDEKQNNIDTELKKKKLQYMQ